AAGQHDKATRQLRTAESMFREMAMEFWSARTYALYADLHTRSGDNARAEQNLRQAIDIFQEIGAKGWVAKYQKTLGGLL
ncbi:MAG: hypothetical protein JSW39_16375, partial [Desulfobacterales bacterium]